MSGSGRRPKPAAPAPPGVAKTPTPAEIAAAWPRELVDVALLILDSVDSTQSFARRLLDRELAEEDPTPIAVVVALEQTAGRGRRGRAWSSTAGLGVWASLIARTAPHELASVPMRAAVALAEALGGLGVAARIKWPNDLVVGRRKLGGVLVDAVTRERGGSFAIVGFGVNVGHGEADLPLPVATSMRVELGAPPPLAEVLARCVEALRRRLDAGDPGWLQRYRELSAHAPGESIECDLDGERVAGRFLGFDERGFLLLDTDGGERRISSGDVFRW